MFREPTELKQTRFSCLIIAAIGTAFYLGSLLLSSFGPNLNATYRGLTLIHSLHPFLFFAMIFINGGTLKLPYLAVFSGMYVLCALADWIGFITKTYYLSNCNNCSQSSLGFMWSGVFCDGMMSIMATAQIPVTVYMARVTDKYTRMRDMFLDYVLSVTDISENDIAGIKEIGRDPAKQTEQGQKKRRSKGSTSSTEGKQEIRNEPKYETKTEENDETSVVQEGGTFYEGQESNEDIVKIHQNIVSETSPFEIQPEDLGTGVNTLGKLRYRLIGGAPISQKMHTGATEPTGEEIT